MKRFLLLVLFLCAGAVSVIAQTPTTTQNARRLPNGSGAPTGSCVAGPPFIQTYIDSSTTPPTTYYCKAGTWTASSGAGSAAPKDATYITETANTTLTNEFALGSLATGILKNTTTTGVPSVIVPGTGVETALAVNVGSAGAFVTFNGALGTPSSGTATNLTGTASGLTVGNVTGTGVASATSLALGGATIGTNNLAVTGKSAFSSQMVVTGPSGDYTIVASNLAAAGSSYGLEINAGGNSSDWPFIVNDRVGATLLLLRGDGDLQLTKTVTAAGTTGTQTINKTTGSVNFAASATSLVVTNSLVAATSIIQCTVGTNDVTMKSVQCVPGSGSFTIFANAAATAETRVNFTVTN